MMLATRVPAANAPVPAVTLGTIPTLRPVLDVTVTVDPELEPPAEENAATDVATATLAVL
jgi:hypothetical protein